MSEDAVIYEAAQGTATLTLNRPEYKNTLSVEVINGLGDSLTQAQQDDSVRVVVLTNKGNTFCAGANLKDPHPDTPMRYSLVEIFTLLRQCSKPVVGRIAGHCTGGGVGLAAACDLSIAAQDVVFGFTEVRIGVAPAMISVVCLPKMRPADAMELFLSGEKISASRAAEVGLLNYAVPREELDQRLKVMVDKICLGGPLALAASKQLVAQVPGMDVASAFAWTEKLSGELFRSEEAAAGIAAFRKRESAPWVPESRKS